jgi:hypothetical protein
MKAHQRISSKDYWRRPKKIAHGFSREFASRQGGEWF